MKKEKYINNIFFKTTLKLEKNDDKKMAISSNDYHLTRFRSMSLKICSWSSKLYLISVYFTLFVSDNLNKLRTT